MIYKKLLCGIGTLTICFMLTGCCMSHEWKEATCTEPKTCAKCGETEGEALGHTWVDATCAEPKTCSVCGEIEGEALGHTWVDATCAEPKHCNVCGVTEGNALEHSLTEANYQQAATCEVCGETVGEPLQADFEKYGLVCNAELDTPYPIVAPCVDEDYTTTGNVTFSDYDIFESDETHEALDGYEWRAVTCTAEFDDENVHQHGGVAANRLIFFVDDYYNSIDDTYNENTNTFTVNYNGTDYTNAKDESEFLQYGWINGVATAQFRVVLRLPKGYDGLVVSIYREKDTLDDNALITDKIADDTVFFRLK